MTPLPAPHPHGLLARSLASLLTNLSLSDGFFAFFTIPVLASSRRPDPSAMEVEPKKLKGKRDLIMPKSFQQVDFWCKWSLELFPGLLFPTPLTLPHSLAEMHGPEGRLQGGAAPYLLSCTAVFRGAAMG